MDFRTVEIAFDVIGKLGALCATEGITSDTKRKANEDIVKIYNSILSPNFQLLTANAKGIITN